jgi:hypothetical protein
MMGGMRGIGGVFFGEIPLKVVTLPCRSIKKARTTHPHTASMEIHRACDERSSNYYRLCPRQQIAARNPLASNIGEGLSPPVWIV